MKYRIDVGFTGYTTVEVEAKSKAKAEDLAIEKIQSLNLKCADLSSKSFTTCVLDDECV